MAFFRRFFLVGLFAVLVWLTGFAAFAFYALSAPIPELNRTSDAIIVLTGGTDRIEDGLELFATGKASHLFISGVHPDVKKAEILAKWSGETALPPCCWELGRTATTTYENAQESRDWARDNDITSIVLVTSNYHMPRAMLEFNAVLPDVDIVPYAIEQSDLDQKEKRIWFLLFEEYHKLLLRWLQLAFS